MRDKKVEKQIKVVEEDKVAKHTLVLKCERDGIVIDR